MRLYKKSTPYIILILIIIGGFGFSFLKYEFTLTGEKSYFNIKVRPAFAKYPALRNIFKLKSDGDSKTDYLLHDKFSKIIIEFDRVESCKIGKNILDEFAGKVTLYSQKPNGTEVVLSDVIDKPKKSYTGEETANLENTFRNFYPKADSAALYILCLSKFAEAPTNVGSTLGSEGIIIYEKTADEISGGNKETKDNVILSTLIHEFGHQLGLEHINNPGCIMHSSIKTARAASIRTNIKTNLCDESVRNIELIRQNL